MWWRRYWWYCNYYTIIIAAGFHATYSLSDRWGILKERIFLVVKSVSNSWWMTNDEYCQYTILQYTVCVCCVFDRVYLLLPPRNPIHPWEGQIHSQAHELLQQWKSSSILLDSICRWCVFRQWKTIRRIESWITLHWVATFPRKLACLEPLIKDKFSNRPL